MKTHLDCISCLMAQSLRAARAVNDDEMVHREVLDAIARMIPELSLDATPPEITQKGYRLIRQITGAEDPFKAAKQKANHAALNLVPRLNEILDESGDRLFTACKLAIAGNWIDLAPAMKKVSMADVLKAALETPLTIDNYAEFRREAGTADTILYLCDNAGEIVFDRLLIGELLSINPDVSVTAIVRDKPVINDATVEDAIAVGLDRVAKIRSSGADIPATVISQCSKEVQDAFATADMVISKGQGNFETLNDESRQIYFLLTAKCPIIGKLLDVQVGNAVLLKNNG